MKYFYIASILISTHFLIHLRTQPGYIHPDEFFQSIEISAKNVLNYEIIEAWEFDKENPLRSQAIIELFLNIPLKLTLNLLEFTKISHKSIDLLKFFRFLTTFYSLINFYCIFLLSKNKLISLILYGSSYISLVFFSRTFSNCWETQILSLFIIIFIKKSSREMEFLQGLIICLGVFCRPTFLFFVFPFIFQKIINQSFQYNCNYFIRGFFGFCSLAVCFIGFDTKYYRMNDLNFTGSFFDYCLVFRKNIVFVPLNFIIYNSQSNNLMSHGLHSFYTHALINLPQMLGPLFLIFLFSFFFVRQSNCIHWLLFNIIFPIFSLSFFPHQEMRFLLPIFPLSIVLISYIINHYYSMGYKKVTKLILIFHFIFNVALTIFWGYFHEGGLITASNFITKDIQFKSQSQCNIIVSYKTLLLPKFLFEITNPNPCNNTVINLMGINEVSFFEKLHKIKSDLKRKSKVTMLHIVYPRAYLIEDSQRFKSLGTVVSHVIVQWHINTDLWRSNVSLYDFVSLQYTKFLI